MRLAHFIVKMASIALTGVPLLAAPASAQVRLPSTLTMTSYDTGTAAFNITVAIGKMMKDRYGADVRVLPAGNDVARLQPLRAGRAVMSAMGSGVYFAQEGVFEFASREWGPQSVQISLAALDCPGTNLGIARDSGAKTLSELRGKRVGFVVGSPSLNQGTLALLAFAGLTEKDVRIVEFSSYGAMWKGMLSNEVDAAFATTITGPTKELESSPRGLVWPTLSFSDTAGWERLRKIGPFFTQHKATCGAGGLSAGKPIEMGAYPYPIYAVYGTQGENDVYMLTKAMIEGYGAYKDGAPGASRLDAKLQTKNWAVPVHKGAVRALREARAWSNDQERHNNNLMRRQETLAAAWDDYIRTNPPSASREFSDGWMKARAVALSRAGMANGLVDEPPPAAGFLTTTQVPPTFAPASPAPPTISAPPAAPQTLNVASKDKRVALVIGNSK